MNQPVQTFITSAQGKARWQVPIYFGVNFLFLLWLIVLQPALWRETGFWPMAGLTLGVSVVAIFGLTGIYYVFFETIRFIDPAQQCVTAEVRLLGRTIRRRTWPFSEFKSIEVNHSGDDNGRYDDEVGLRHSAGWFLLLQRFPAGSQYHSERALILAGKLSVTTGLAYGVQKIAGIKLRMKSTRWGTHFQEPSSTPKGRRWRGFFDRVKQINRMDQKVERQRMDYK